MSTKPLDALFVLNGRTNSYASLATFLGHQLDCPVIVLAEQNTVWGKRNEAMDIGRSCDWRHILIMDDDVWVEKNNPFQEEWPLGEVWELLGWAADMDTPASGFRIVDFPDNSTVRHACRLAGDDVPVTIGGAILLLDLAYPHRDFPPVYNEDWFFLRDLRRQNLVGDAGKGGQIPYDPFIPGRAALEELGDLLAEAAEEAEDRDLVYSEFWAKAILERHGLIESTRAQLGDYPEAQASLMEAQDILRGITPEFAVECAKDWILR